jgi:hypothetical protein
MSNNLTGATVSSTFGKLVQTVGGLYYDGFGNLLELGGATGPTGADGSQGPTGPTGATGSQGSPAPSYIRRNETISNINYCGFAIDGSLDTDSVWSITKITVNIDGSVTTQFFSNVRWIDYNTL